MNPKKLTIAFTIPLLLGLLLLIGILQNGGLVSAENIKVTPTIDDPISKSLLAEISNYDKDLKDPKLSPASKRIVEANKKYAEKQATQRADHLAHKDEYLATKQAFIAKETEQPSFPRQNNKTKTPKGPERGIYYDPGFRNIPDAGFINAWVEPGVDEVVWYLAGRSYQNVDQGVVFIYHSGTAKVEKYILSEKSGRLKVIGLEGTRIKLSSEKGKTYFFEVNAHQFLDENGSMLITLTPTPTPEPTIPAYP